METASEWVSPWWQAACLPQRWEVAGIRDIAPLSCWHVFALESIGNAFVTGGRCDRDAAAALLLVVTLDHAGGQRLMLDARYRAKRQRRILRAINRVDDVTLYRACVSYVSDCCYTPRMWSDSPRETSDGNASAAPYSWHIVRCLCHDYRMTIEAAWNTSYAYGRCLYCASYEAAGGDKLMKPWQQRIDDAMVAETKEATA